MNAAIIKSLIDLGVPAVRSLFGMQSEKDKAERQFRAKLLEVDQSRLNIQGELLKTELQGDKIQRRWRPHLMYLFMALLVFSVPFAALYNSLIVALFGWVGLKLPPLDLAQYWKAIPKEFWYLLMTGFGGYITSRGFEKVMTNPDRVREISKRKFPQLRRRADPYQDRADIQVTQEVGYTDTPATDDIIYQQVDFREQGER